MAELVTYGRVEKVKCEEKSPAVVIVNNGKKRVPVVIPQDHYQRLLNRNNGTFMTQEVEVYSEKNGNISIQVFD